MSQLILKAVFIVSSLISSPPMIICDFSFDELQEMEKSTSLTKLNLVNVPDFVTQDTMAVIFYYKAVQELEWIPWLERSYAALDSVPFGYLNCSSDLNYYASENCADLGLSAPSVRVYRYGYTLGEYEGQMEDRGLVRYIRKWMPTSLVRLDTMGALTKFLETTNRTMVVGFFKRETDLEQIFVDVAKTFRGVVFGYSSGEEVLDKMDFSNDIVLFYPKIIQSDYEDTYIKYSGEANVGVFEQFLRKYKNGLVGIRSYYDVHEFDNPLIVAYFDLSQKDKFQKYRHFMLPVAKKYINVTFAVSQTLEFIDDLKDFGISLDILDGEVLVLAQTALNHKYVLGNLENEEHFRNFVYNFQNNKLIQFVKSQSLDHSKKHTDKSVVYMAVGKNFLKVIQEPKDHLILLYHFDCLGELVTLEFVAMEFDNFFDREFANHKTKMGYVAMNVEFNDVSYPYYFNRCPTFFFAAKGFKDKPVLYGGSPDYRKLYEFTKQHIRLFRMMRGDE